MLMMLSLVSVSSTGIKEDKVYELDENTIPYELDLDLPDFITDEFYKYTLHDYGEEKRHMFYIKDDSEIKKQQSNFNNDIKNIKCRVDTYETLIEQYGLPNKVLIAEAGDVYYLNIYYGDVQLFFGVDSNVLREIRFHEKTTFVFEDSITVGSTLDEVLTLYPAKNIVENHAVNFRKDNTLYKNINNQPGYHYINYPERKLRLFFSDNKISALYIY